MLGGLAEGALARMRATRRWRGWGAGFFFWMASGGCGVRVVFLGGGWGECVGCGFFFWVAGGGVGKLFLLSSSFFGLTAV